jgi:hypothetical protein
LRIAKNPLAMNAGDRVRLLKPFSSIGAGAVGIVRGFYRNETEEKALVLFDQYGDVIPVKYLEVVREGQAPGPAHTA